MTPDLPARDALLARVRAALGRAGLSAPETPPRDPALLRLVAHAEPLPSLFAERAAGVGISVERVTTTALRDSLGSLLRRLGVQRPAISIEDDSLRASAEAAAGGSIEWRSAPALDALYNADVGITDTLGAIAETGTIIVRSSPLTTRGGFLVPPIHIALLPASRILPDMIDLWPLLMPMPTAVVLITGPSKTADIEGILITGVHGPKSVHILLIDDA